ncbi:hypothetical protein J437_LFUL007448 [Ladona fulva]|uniref:Attractin n=1 Tax=Ladona fulva TaxID=123851 RepID=A0A8K0KCI6_LADFU|nr:hypothetical protein J437_LFUL007448 [Ladona fulva]
MLIKIHLNHTINYNNSVIRRELLASAPSARFLHSAVVIRGLVLFFGGNTHNDTAFSHGAKCYSSDFFAYDPVCDKWITNLGSGPAPSSAFPPTAGHPAPPRFGHSSVVYKGVTYVYGGFDGQMLSDLQSYTPGNCSYFKDAESCLRANPGVKCVWVGGNTVGGGRLGSNPAGGILDGHCEVISEATRSPNEGSGIILCPEELLYDPPKYVPQLESVPAVLTTPIPSISSAVAPSPSQPLDGEANEFCSSLNTCASCVQTSKRCTWCSRTAVCVNGSCKDGVKGITRLGQCAQQDSLVCSQLHNCQACTGFSHCRWDYESRCKTTIGEINDDLTIDYQFTFNLSKKEDRHYTQINFKNSPPKPDVDADFHITCSVFAKMNISVKTGNKTSDVRGGEPLPAPPLYTSFSPTPTTSQVGRSDDAVDGLAAPSATEVMVDSPSAAAVGIGSDLSGDVVICNTPCSELTSCMNCTVEECIWCQNEGRCVDKNAYTASFPYGQCREWTTLQSRCRPTPSGRPSCSFYRTCEDCRADPACGWCDDGSGTGLGDCLPGGYSDPMTPHKCKRNNWYFTQCPTCQCNGHSTCANGTNVCNQPCANLTHGAHCQHCVLGYYGNPVNGGRCNPCECNDQGTQCHSETGKCYCTTKGIVGDHCERCDQQNHYFGDPTEHGSCFSNSPEKYLVTDKNCSSFRSRFAKSEYSFGTEDNVTLTTFHVYVYDFHPPLWIQISFSQYPKLNLQQFFITFSTCFLLLLLRLFVEMEQMASRPFSQVLVEIETRERESHHEPDLEDELDDVGGEEGDESEANNRVEGGDWTEEGWRRKRGNSRVHSSSGVGRGNKGRRNAENSGKQLSPVATLQPVTAAVEVATATLRKRKKDSPSPIALEPCSGNRAAVLSLLIRLPTGGETYTPPGQSGLAIASALVTLGNPRKASIDPTGKSDSKTKTRKSANSQHPDSCI